jgi:hypothetical protein
MHSKTGCGEKIFDFLIARHNDLKKQRDSPLMVLLPIFTTLG